jgi:thiamine pyrophosphate-dependent acetolactate synthase large subunit-like protein
LTVAEAVAEVVLGRGASHVFGLVGSGNLALVNALLRGGASYHAACHEAGAVAAADAYARISRRVGVATVHQGPGLTNALTALTEAVRAHTPLVLLASEAVAGNQRLDQARVVEAVGAAVEQLRSPADAARAFDRAAAERRPIVLTMPVDVQRSTAVDVEVEPPVQVERPRASPEAVAALVDELARAERPVLLAGRGAVLAEARDPLERLAELAGATLATTACANGLFRGSDRSLGIAGGFASPLAARVLREADLVVAFGASLNRWTTGDGALLEGTRVVQVDVDQAAFGANHPVDLAIVGDAAEVALAAAPGRGRELDPALRDELARYRRRDEIDDRSTAELIDPRTLTVLLDDLLPAERTIAIDSGHFMGWPAMYLSPPDPDGFLLGQAFQSVGLGLAHGIGAAVARPDRVAVALLGDGGARMSLMELETAVRESLRLLAVIYDDAGYGAEIHDYGPLGIDVEVARFPERDFAGVVRGLGAAAATVRTAADLDVVARWSNGPLLLDCKVSRDVRGDW